MGENVARDCSVNVSETKVVFLCQGFFRVLGMSVRIVEKRDYQEMRKEEMEWRE